MPTPQVEVCELVAPTSVLKKIKESLKPNSITLAVSQLVRSWSPTSFEPASVMEFGFYAAYI